MSLKEQIIDSLRKNPGQHAKTIASELGVTRTEVNSVLYRQIQGIVIQDKTYKWSLADTKSDSSKRAGIVQLDTQLAKLAQYYLDCISFDDEREISMFAESRYAPDYIELEELPLVTESGITSALQTARAQQLAYSIRKDKKRLELALGYPCFLKQLRARSGWEGMMVQPLFMFPLTAIDPNEQNQYELDSKSVSLNYGLLNRLIGQNGFGMEEGIQLMEDLGLGQTEQDIEWDEVFARLQMIRPDWQWVENLNANKLHREKPLSQEKTVGFYNRAILFGKELSPYTVGLEKELAKLRSVDEILYKDTCLGRWITGDSMSENAPDERLLEIIPLNTEQREAVKKGLTQPLTVITGPPGTGKSQVVTSILLNAAWKGKRVLFASKNNKAVDVVETRVNALGPRPILLRLGTDKIRAELATYLLNMLAAKTTQEDRTRYNETKDIYSSSKDKISELENHTQQIIKKRNELRTVEARLAPIRDKYDEKTFESLQSIDLAKLRNSQNEIERVVNNADRERQNFLTKAFWFFHQRDRFDRLVSMGANVLDTLEELQIKQPNIKTSLSQWRRVQDEVDVRIHDIREIQRYFKLLNDLVKAGDISDLHTKIHSVVDENMEIANELWANWLALQPSRLSQEDRRTLGDYAAILQLIVKTNETGGQLSQEVFRRYYQLFPKIAQLLPCWAITSLSANGRVPLEPNFFDLVVIDEASQCDIASALPLLYRAKSAVIIGDPKQLCHISGLSPNRDRALLSRYGLVNNYASWSYSVTSVFDLASRLCRSEDITVLRDHHRSHHDIIEFSNKHFYEGRLRIATKRERLRPSAPNEIGIRWIETNGKIMRSQSGGCHNLEEAVAIMKELKRLIIEQRYEGTIGVVTPFRAQANLIREITSQDNLLSPYLAGADFLAETAHRFQGDERDIMFFSPVVENGMPKGAEMFLRKTPNLFNVAITRARSTLIIVGSHGAMAQCKVNHFEAFANYFASLHNQTANKKPEAAEDCGPDYPKVANPEKVSDWERWFYKKLYTSGLRPTPQYDVENYTLDYAFFDGPRKLNVEVDGERYHRDWDGDLILRDRLRNQRMIELGWDVKRFWVYQIRDDTDACIKRIKKWFQNPRS
jgi:superfamily I DNA and/or RNA helicase/very-short-patch-repair endonuclease